MRARELCRLNDLRYRHAGIGKRDVLADSAVEEFIFLQHDANLA